jgi:hypothetical protein
LGHDCTHLALLEKKFPNSFEPLNDVSKFSGQHDGKMVLLHKQVFEYRFSEQFTRNPEKKLVSEYVHPSYKAG